MIRIVGFIFIILFAIFLRAPAVTGGLPYFYHEDEAHHFNRLAEIAKSGDLNPHYFHKPSLHFYLRLPIFYGTYAALRSTGQISSLNEIVTRDRFGLADYSFSASHPWFLVTSRLTSLFFTLATIFLFLPLSRYLRFTNLGAFCAAGALALLPPFITYAGTVGVDTPMALLCLASSVFSVKLLTRPSTFNLVVAALLAGAAVSTKYNALPIVVVPFFALFLSGERLFSRYVLSAVLPTIGFIACSPFILVELPRFWEQLSYEVWHYSVAGHVGNQEEPGVKQALFYLGWFWREATGPSLLILGALGTAVLTRSRAGLVFLLFPALYFLEMSVQRANFTRNMLVFLPYVALAAGALISFLQRRVTAPIFYIFFIGASLFVIKDLVPSILVERYNLNRPESRVEAARIVSSDSVRETAVAGELQFEPGIFKAPNVHRVRLEGSTVQRIFAAGFDRAVVDDGFFVPDFLKTLTFKPSIDADPSSNPRVIRDPGIRVVELADSSQTLKLELLKSPLSTISFDKDGSSDCEGFKSEGRCWLTWRTTQLRLPKNRGLKLEIESPWGNVVEIHGGKTVESVALTPNVPSTIKIPYASNLVIYVKNINQPKKLGLNSDERRLGAAIIRYEIF